MRYKGQEGAITVFLSIILLIMVTLACVIVDVARINTADSQIQRAVETSVRSALAGYYTPLKEHYGLFALNENNSEKLKEVIEDYLNKNLMINKEYLDENKIGNYLDLYNYEVESIEIEPIFNLTEDPVTRQQILEYMKYRAPKKFVYEFIDKLKVLKKAGPTSEAYEKKMKFEKSLRKIENIQREIYKNIYGKYEKRILWLYEKKEDLHFVRKLGKKEYSRLIDEYVDVIYDYKRLRQRLEAVNKLIAEAESDDKKKRLKKSKKRIKEQIKETSYDMDEKYDKFTRNIKKYFDINENTKVKINELVDNSKEIRSKLNMLKEDLEKNKEDIMDESYKKLSVEIKEQEKLLLDMEEGKEAGYKKSGFEKMEEKLEENKETLQGEKNNSNILKLIREIEPDKAKKLAVKNLELDKISKVDSVKEKSIKEIEGYNNDIKYNYLLKNRDSSYKKYDKREESQEKANEEINIKGSEEHQKGIVISKEEYEILPSIVDSQLDEEREARKNALGFLWGNDTDEGERNKEVKKIEFHDEEESGFSEAAFSFMGGMAQQINIEENFKDTIDKIYINEYIMGIFKNYVSDLREDERYNLRHQEKSDQVSYFNKSEVEYILNGSKSEKINQTVTDSKIVLTRFCLNSIHVFTCEKKQAIAETTAMAVAGWYTGGAGVPIIKTLILLSWSMEESMLDLNTLKAGGEVPLYKINDMYWESGFGKNKAAKTSLSKGILDKTSKKESSSSISLDKENSDDLSLDEKKPDSKEKGILYTSYQDYLRFFLLVQDTEVTMKRIQDLIQLDMNRITDNSDFRLDQFNTYIRVEAVVSIKYLFLTQSFVPEKFKTQNDRHKFKVIIYQGY